MELLVLERGMEIFYSSVFIYYLRGNRGLEIYYLDKI